MNNTIKFDRKSLNIRLLFLVVVLIFFISSSYVIVDSGHVGVVNRLGAIQEIALNEGFHFKLPFIDKVSFMDIRLTKVKAEAHSASKDLQTVRTGITVQGSINGVLAPSMYQKIGSVSVIHSTIVESAIQESVKAVTAKYTAEELITKRAEVKIAIQSAIQKFIDVTLKQKKIIDGVYIANVAITDFDFSTEFNKAIELKVRAEQEALQAKNEKIKRVTQAEASAEEKKLNASANAYEIAVQSKARAEAIKRESRALKNNPELIQLRIAEKWDGKLPTFNGSNAVPFLNISEGKTK